MSILDKIGAGITSTVEVIVEKNRQLAQLNRLSAIIRTESEVINHAYAALGKHYYKILDKTENETDMTGICEVIRFSEERRRKAQARYDYIKAFGMPKKVMDTADMIHYTESGFDSFTETPSEQEITEEETGDITIAVAEDEADHQAAEAAKETPVSNKRRSHKKAEPADTEAEDDLTDL